MSVADHEIEPVDEDEGWWWCMVHEHYYDAWVGCTGCMDDAHDRQYDSKKEREI